MVEPLKIRDYPDQPLRTHGVVTEWLDRDGPCWVKCGHPIKRGDRFILLVEGPLTINSVVGYCHEGCIEKVRW